MHYRFNIPKDYQIDYDKNKNYNQKDNPNYLPPYRSDEYKSVYDGIEVEMHIVNHCNLKCNCCNHFSPLAEPWFISLESFKEQLTLLKNNISSLKKFILIGGEPALHPQLYELCKIAREVLGQEIIITVLSNGTITKNIIDKKEQYLKLNINFTFSSYMEKTNFEQIKQIPLSNVYNTRILSKQTLVDPSGTIDGFNNFFNCVDHKLPCFTLKEKKLYICPFSAHLEHFCKKFNVTIPEEKWIDYLPIDEIKNDLDILQTFCFTPKNICKYCNPEEAGIPFDTSKKDFIEFTMPLKDLYNYDYSRYEQTINAGKNNIINWAINKELNPGRVDSDFQTLDFYTEYVRYGNGKIDIVIPYYNENISQFLLLKENLLSQTIIQNCMIYFISDKSNMDIAVQNIFRNQEKLHCVFLRNEEHQGPGAARNIGIKNSHNKYILFLDADDLFIKETALEEMYNLIEKEKQQAILFKMYDDNYTIKHSFFIKKDVLNDNNLFYKNIFFGEDNEFYIRLFSLIPEELLYQIDNKENIFIKYNASTGINITSTFIEYDQLHFSFLTSSFIGIIEANKKNIINKTFFKDSIMFYINRIIMLLDEEHLFLRENLFIQSLIYFIINKLFEIEPILIESKEIQYLLKILNLEINPYYLTYIKHFLITYIDKNYLNNIKLKTNVHYIKEIINKC